MYCQSCLYEMSINLDVYSFYLRGCLQVQFTRSNLAVNHGGVIFGNHFKNNATTWCGEGDSIQIQLHPAELYDPVSCDTFGASRLAWGKFHRVPCKCGIDHVAWRPSMPGAGSWDKLMERCSDRALDAQPEQRYPRLDKHRFKNWQNRDKW